MQDETPSVETKRVGMDQLRFFVQMVKSHLDDAGMVFPGYDTHFWRTLRKRCPELAQAIDTAFTGPWSPVTFTSEIASLTLTYGDLAAATEALKQSNYQNEQEGDVPTYE